LAGKLNRMHVRMGIKKMATVTIEIPISAS
jgi:hypothetical protein